MPSVKEILWTAVVVVVVLAVVNRVEPLKKIVQG